VSALALSRQDSKGHTLVAKAVYSREICGTAEAVPFVQRFSVQYRQDRGNSADRQRAIFGQIPRITFRRQDSRGDGLPNPPKKCAKSAKSPVAYAPVRRYSGGSLSLLFEGVDKSL
jgi:hypothetical protein